jgi:hypothetical protein
MVHAPGKLAKLALCWWTARCEYHDLIGVRAEDSVEREQVEMWIQIRRAAKLHKAEGLAFPTRTLHQRVDLRDYDPQYCGQKRAAASNRDPAAWAMTSSRWRAVGLSDFVGAAAEPKTSA